MPKHKKMNRKSNNTDTPLIEHIEALRQMLLRSICAIALLSPAGFFLAPKFIDFLVKNSIPQNAAKLHYFSPMEVFVIQLKIGIIIAFALAFPYVVYEVRKFVLPALYENEKKFLGTFILSSTSLFLLGAASCVFAILPLIMKFSLGFANENIEATLGLNNFISLSGALLLAFGLMFQFPLIVIALVKFDVVEISTLINLRPYIIVVILILAAIFTPPDVISQIMLALPTWLLYEAGLLIAKRIKGS